MSNYVSLYRKKPVVIETIQFTEETKDRVFSWIRGENGHVSADRDEDGNPTLIIWTLEGKMTASLGDWIIRGIKGEFYPCKPDIFDATYEVAA